MNNQKIILPGGAGLVGQNLIARLKARGYTNIVVLDKHAANVEVLRRMHPDVLTECVDLSAPGSWQAHFAQAGAVVMLQAQIGGIDYAEFERNNLTSTRLILDAVRAGRVDQLVHISSSVVESVADDFYTETKKIQERMVLDSGIACPVLRPTLMFGWFDRKHLGWLARFMRKSPLFPIPGSGRFIRQPLFVADFCQLIERCLLDPSIQGVYDITGMEKVSYLTLMRQLRQAVSSRSWIIHLPIPLFAVLLQLWALISRQPAFTQSQLKALTAGDEFEVIDWPALFHVSATPLAEALRITYQDRRFSSLEMPF